MTEIEKTEENTDIQEFFEEKGIVEEQPVSVDRGEDDNSDLNRFMAQNFIEYASYVIKDRAIPHIDDGMKPVQRRILYSLKQMDDGKFHKVANVIGHTMQFHPHGDKSIGDALVVLANKDFFIEKQGNFGNILTGDVASAARYIECRLSPMARETLFNKELTEYIDSYDGRNKEPVTLPAKVPALLMQGADGIAVGMATKIMPHNFCELLNAQIAILRNEPFILYPDFTHGALMEIDNYEDGNGKLKLRAKIEKSKKSTKTLYIRSVPPTTTTEQVIHSIEEAAKKKKLKINSIDDYTAENVEIEVILQRGVNADKAIHALYGYTKCEVSISPNLIVIKDEKPFETNVSDVLRYNTVKLVVDLRRELELNLQHLENLLHFKNLEQIFIENRIYKRIEKCKTEKEIMLAVRTGFDPFMKFIVHEITDEDIEKLLRIVIKRISQFDIEKSKKDRLQLLDDIRKIRSHLQNLKRYAIKFIENLLAKYGDQYPRRTKIANFHEVDMKKVALKNIKVGYDRLNGFVGSSVKTDDWLACTEFDRLVLFSRKSGKAKVIPIPDKLYIGQGMEIYKSNKDQVYSIIYKNKKNGNIYAKRFRMDSFIMDKEYKTLPKNCRIERIYTTYGVVVKCEYVHNPRYKEQSCDIIFDQLDMRSKTAGGFKITDKPLERYNLIARGTENPKSNEDSTNKEQFKSHVIKDEIPMNGELLIEQSANETKEKIAKIIRDAKQFVLDNPMPPEINIPDLLEEKSQQKEEKEKTEQEKQPKPEKEVEKSIKKDEPKPIKKNPKKKTKPTKKKEIDKKIKPKATGFGQSKKARKLIDEETPFILE
ncbi:MAG: DNA topoisomerase IV subunit A [Verrucomicrobiota bacterium]|nr:DNA topoisomerase IV subunit A [Verrucomicrobiota bacterium]